MVSEHQHGGHSFCRHLVEMFVAMVIGMLAAVFVYLTVANFTGAKTTREEALVGYPCRAFSRSRPG